MESTKSGNPTVGITLPVAFMASLAILLFLIVRSVGYEELALNNEREAARRQELAVQVGPLKEQVEAARGELAGLRTELKSLTEQRKAALESIDQANALAKSLQQLRSDVAALDKEGQDKRRGLGDAEEKLAALNKQVSVAEEQLRERRAELAGLSTQLGSLTTREKTVAQSLVEKERALSAKSVELDTKTEEARQLALRVAARKGEAEAAEAQLQELSKKRGGLTEATAQREALLGQLAELERSLGTKRREVDDLTLQTKALERIATDRKAEADSQEARLKRYSNEKVTLDEVERLRAERWELQARLGVLKEDRLSVTAAIKGLEETKQRLENEVALLAQRRAAAEAAAQTKKN